MSKKGAVVSQLVPKLKESVPPPPPPGTKASGLEPTVVIHTVQALSVIVFLVQEIGLYSMSGFMYEKQHVAHSNDYQVWNWVLISFSGL